MGKIFLTADPHFFHKKLLEIYCPNRPGHSVGEMNSILVANWNTTVSKDDTVFVVGDFFMGPKEGIDEILPLLNGKIILIRGNHDTNNRVAMFEERGVTVADYAVIERDGYNFYLYHYPMTEERFNWDVFNGVMEDYYDDFNDWNPILLYGHVHDNAPDDVFKNEFGYTCYHVGMDTNNFKPVLLDDIVKKVDIFNGQ